MLFKKSVSPVVASLLLVTMAIVIGVYVFNWYSDYTTGVTRDISEKQYSKDIRTDYVGKNVLYGYNEYNNFKPDKVLIDGNECEILNSDETFSEGTFEIQFDESCSQGLTSSMNEILIITDKGSYKSLLTVSDATYTYGDSSGGGGGDTTNYCSSGSVTHNSITFSHGTIEDTQSPTLSKTDTITGGTKKSYIDVTCNYPNVVKDENSFYSEVTCTGNYEKNTEGTACIETTTDQIYCPAQSSYIHNGITFIYEYETQNNEEVQIIQNEEIEGGFKHHTSNATCSAPNLVYIDDSYTTSISCTETGYIESGDSCILSQAPMCSAGSGSIQGEIFSSYNYDYTYSNLEKDEIDYYGDMESLKNGFGYIDYGVNITCSDVESNIVIPKITKEILYCDEDNGYFENSDGTNCILEQTNGCSGTYKDFDGAVSFDYSLEAGRSSSWDNEQPIPIENGEIDLYLISFSCSDQEQISFEDPTIIISCDTSNGYSLSLDGRECISQEGFAFVSHWKIEDSDKTLTLPLKSNGEYDFTIDWGDNSAERSVTRFDSDYASKQYSSSGTYRVVITGKINGFGFNNGEDKEKLINITSWGELNLGNEGGYFYGAENLESLPDKVFNTTGTQDFSNMFRGAKKFNSPITNWDFSDATDMSYMFNGATSFNQNINSWNTQNVEDMSYMFNGATSFNGEMSSWDTESVINMSNMFNGATSFNQNINSWNTQNVEDMSHMFSSTDNFDQNLGDWDVSNVLNMSHMFSDKNVYNFDLSRWEPLKVTDMSYIFSGANIGTSLVLEWNILNVLNMSHMFSNNLGHIDGLTNWETESVTDMSYMFNGAINFNEHLGWTTSNVLDMSYMFNGATSFNGFLINWNTQNVEDMSYMFNGATSFDRDIGYFDTQNVEDMSYMFYNAESFNQDLLNWNVDNVYNCHDYYNQNNNNWNFAKPQIKYDCSINSLGLGILNNNLALDPELSVLWARSSFGVFPWGDANSVCNRLNYESYSDWRLPTESELKSLGTKILGSYDEFKIIFSGINDEYINRHVTEAWTNERDYINGRATSFDLKFGGLSDTYDTISNYALCVRNS